jgi:creatinine amidohydrolase
METPHASHACEYETSMMLAVAGDMVQMSEARAGDVVIDSKFYHSELGGQVTLAGRFHRRTSTGAMGRPDLGTADKGSSLIEAAVEDTVALLSDFLTWETPHVFSADKS